MTPSYQSVASHITNTRHEGGGGEAEMLDMKNNDVAGGNNNSGTRGEQQQRSSLEVGVNGGLVKQSSVDCGIVGVGVGGVVGGDNINNLSFDIGPSELIRHPLAWHVSTCLILTTIGGMYLAGTYKVYGLEIFRSEMFLSTVGSMSSIFNSGGRIFWGGISDKYGAIQTVTGLSCVYAFIILTYSSSPRLGGEIGFTLWTFLIFFFEGGNFALYPPICSQLFGLKNSGSNYGIIFSLYSLCCVLNITILARYSVSFTTSCELMGIVTFVGFLNLLLLQRHMRSVFVCKRED